MHALGPYLIIMLNAKVPIVKLNYLFQKMNLMMFSYNRELIQIRK